MRSRRRREQEEERERRMDFVPEVSAINTEVRGAAGGGSRPSLSSSSSDPLSGMSTKSSMAGSSAR